MGRIVDHPILVFVLAVLTLWLSAYVDLLPSADGAKVRDLLKSCLDQRVLFYEARDERQLGLIAAKDRATTK